MKRLLALEAGMGIGAAEDKHASAGTAVLMRGMRRRTWTGPAWLSLTNGSQVLQRTKTVGPWCTDETAACIPQKHVHVYWHCHVPFHLLMPARQLTNGGFMLRCRL